MLTISVPDLSPELSWVCSVLLNDCLGVEYTVQTAHAENFRLHCNGRHIELPNIFFALASRRGFDQSLLPQTPLAVWDSRATGLHPILVKPLVPVIFGSNARPSVVKDDAIYIPIDIFGSAFFMLSRCEEAFNKVRDGHDRFPTAASLAYRENFLDRPIVDEYVEILWTAIRHLWPGLKRKKRMPRTLVSCDVDLPFDPACASLYRLGKRLIGQTWRQKSASAVSGLIKSYLAVKRGDYSRDPYRTAIDWIMDVNEEAGNRVAFYFIPERTDKRIDNSVSLDEPRMRVLMRNIRARGHEIGIHPGYNTYQSPTTFAQSVATLRRVMAEEGITQATLGGRQHYLRWNTPTTATLWDDNGLTYDSTLSFADRPGFRCGTCHEYRMYDLAHRKPLKLLQRPLVTMEASRYDGLEYKNNALEIMQRYKRVCYQFGGNFTLLWHNSYFENRDAKSIYREIISGRETSEQFHASLYTQ